MERGLSFVLIGRLCASGPTHETPRVSSDWIATVQLLPGTGQSGVSE
jgi:hypothetical protein